MTARIKRILMTALVMLCTAVLLCPSAVGAADVFCQSHAVPAGQADALEAEVLLDDFRGDSSSVWMTSTSVTDVKRVNEGDGYALSARLKKNTAGTYGIMCLFGGDVGQNLMLQTKLRFSVFIDGADPVPPDPEPEEGTEPVMHTVRISMHSGVSSMSAETQIPAGEWYTVTVDIEPWRLRTNLHMCEITVTDGGSGVDSFMIGPLSAGGTADMEIADTFLTFGFTAESGEAVYRDGVYLLDPGRDGAITLIADAVREEYTAGSGVSAVRVVLDNAMEGGVISLAVADGSAADAPFTISSTCSVYYGENVYLLPYDSDIKLRAYRLSFHSLTPDAADYVTLRSVSLVSIPETDKTEYPARIRKCSFSDDLRKLEFAGTLSASVTAQYIDGELALYEIPLWEDAQAVLLNGAPVATMRMSSQFTFGVDMSGREHMASVSRYQLAVLSDTGVVPISAALYPERGAEPATSTLSSVGLYGADNAGIFESNASSVILDVYADRLLGGKDGLTSGRLCVRGGQYYYLDNAYIRELDSEINFCLAADVEVYLRLLCASDLSAKGYTRPCEGALLYAFDVYNEAGASALCAVTDYIAQRYSAVSGFIVGERMDAAIYNGADMSDSAGYAALCADTLRLVYNSAVVHIPDVYVIAPLGHYMSEIRELDSEHASGADLYCDPVLLASLISRRIQDLGEIPWGMLYMSDNAAEALGHVQNILVGMKSLDSDVPAETMLLWRPPAAYSPDIVLLEYEDRCFSARQADIRAMFLSVAGFSSTDQAQITAGLKYVLDDTEYRRPLSEYSAQLLTDKPQMYAGRYALHDFSRSYSTQGWIAGSGCERLLTESGAFVGGRSLQAVFSAPDGSLFTPVSGNILCVSGVTDNLSYAPYVHYSLQLTTQLESASEAELVFIFGSGDMRAEYSVTVPTGKPVEILCDLSNFSGAETVDFSAVSVHCDSAVSMNITNITCASSEYDYAALQELYRYRSMASDSMTETSSGVLSDAQKMLLGILLLGSIMALALSSRRRGGRTE